MEVQSTAKYIPTKYFIRNMGKKNRITLSCILMIWATICLKIIL